MNLSIVNQTHKLFLFFLISSLLISCRETKLMVNAPINLDFPETQFYNGLIISNNDVIVLVRNDRGDVQWYAKEGDNEFTKFAFAENTDCSSTKRYGAYETLPDGRLQVWKWCLTDKGGVDYLLAYDWETHPLEKIVGPLPLGSSGASWNPQGTKAIGYLDSGFASKTLFWVYRDGFEPLDLVIQDGNRSWNLQDDFPKFTADDTGKTGTTGRASWSPDGKTIAFFASPNAIGKTSFDRFGVEFYLYLMNPETLQYEVVADNIFSPFLLSWSPDSTHVAFIGKYGFWKENGIWLYSVETNSITEISEGVFQGMAWRPDGNSLVAIECQSLDVCDKILEYDLTSILE
jgi:hypothetical protein